MSSIVEKLLNSLSDISNAYATNIREPSQRMAEKEFELREQGDVFFPFGRSDVLSGKKLIAIDGGRVTNQLSGGDLVVVGATLGDGIASVPAYGDNPPSEAYATVVAHTSKTESEFAETMMSTLELRILSKAVSDYKIIDGAYLGNVSVLLFALLSGNDSLIDVVLQHDEDGRVSDSLQQVLNPAKDNSSGIVSVSKSDSSFVYSQEYLGHQHGLSSLVSDRNLATYFLEPGEFLIPRKLLTNPALVKRMHSRKDKTREDVQSIIQGKLGLLEALGGSLWTTYFKPTRWSKFDRAIKIEFVFFGDINGAIEHAKHMVQVVDADIVNNSIMEPWCQYIADKRAKEVSVGSDLVRNHLLNTVENSVEAQGLLRAYRT